VYLQEIPTTKLLLPEALIFRVAYPGKVVKKLIGIKFMFLVLAKKENPFGKLHHLFSKKI